MYGKVIYIYIYIFVGRQLSIGPEHRPMRVHQIGKKARNSEGSWVEKTGIA